ncbi:MAG: DinB family protein [Gemmatimonadota bacterium]
MTRSHIERSFAHMWWADDRVGEAIEAAPEAGPRAARIYAHVLGTELVWLDRVEAVEQSVAIWPEPDGQTCRDLAGRVRERYTEFLSRLRARELPRPIHYANSAGQEFDTPLEDILLHVALHGSYHRGQIALLLRDAGATPNPTDYIGFVRGVPAATTRDARGIRTRDLLNSRRPRRI